MDVTNHMRSNHYRVKLLRLRRVKKVRGLQSVREYTTHECYRNNETKKISIWKLQSSLFLQNSITTELLDVFCMCEAQPFITDLWKSRFLFTFWSQQRVFSLRRHLWNSGKTERSRWLAVYSARQPHFPSSWLSELKFKETIFSPQKMYHVLTGVC